MFISGKSFSCLDVSDDGYIEHKKFTLLTNSEYEDEYEDEYEEGQCHFILTITTETPDGSKTYIDRNRKACDWVPACKEGSKMFSYTIIS